MELKKILLELIFMVLHPSPPGSIQFTDHRRNVSTAKCSTYYHLVPRLPVHIDILCALHGVNDAQ